MLQHCLVPCETAADLAHIVCTPYNHAPVYNVILFEATCVGCMCVSVSCQLCFWTEWPGFLHCYCGNTGVEWFCVEVFFFMCYIWISFIHIRPVYSYDLGLFCTPKFSTNQNWPKIIITNILSKWKLTRRYDSKYFYYVLQLICFPVQSMPSSVFSVAHV